MPQRRSKAPRSGEPRGYDSYSWRIANFLVAVQLGRVVAGCTSGSSWLGTVISLARLAVVMRFAPIPTHCTRISANDLSHSILAHRDTGSRRFISCLSSDFLVLSARTGLMARPVRHRAGPPPKPDV